ncbi:IS3 family transposase [Olegusella massiliensis]|uniref:IS3 family transposase n=1 Tax=Olegusella massiliensis TaxID=1776381 RepID=UPI0023F7ABA0|nr:IS3 family transposase [Olegusella massiliensis]
MSNKYRLMHAEKANFKVNMMARLLEVSRSGFYEWEKRHGWEDSWAEARKAVKRIWAGSDGRFGFRFVHTCLPDKFSHLTPYRVRKLMRELGIRGCTPNAGKRMTIQDPRAKDKKDLVRRDFTVPVPTVKLCGDITYLRTGEGWLYLATVIDLATRMVVGWSMSERMTADIVVAALENAKGRGYVAENAVFHSDKGSQYTSQMLLDWAEENNVRLSCSRTGNCHDNAVAESFFATLKNEMYYRRSFKTRTDAKRAIFNYIEVFYNRRRPHSTMGYQVPGEVMDAFFARTAPGLRELPMVA